MKNGLFLLAATMLITVASCKKDKSPDKSNTYYYDETQCSDPWFRDIERNSSTFTKELKTWLITKTGVPISEPKREYQVGKAIYCAACSCTSGNVLFIWPVKGTEQKFIDLGFRKAE